MTAVPFAIKASYQTRHYNAGIPQNPDSVFDALATPPASGVAAETADLARATHVLNADGTQGAQLAAHPDSRALMGAYAHRDWIREFYDSASILRTDES